MRHIVSQEMKSHCPACPPQPSSPLHWSRLVSAATSPSSPWRLVVSSLVCRLVSLLPGGWRAGGGGGGGGCTLILTRLLHLSLKSVSTIYYMEWSPAQGNVYVFLLTYVRRLRTITICSYSRLVSDVSCQSTLNRLVIFKILKQHNLMR